MTKNSMKLDVSIGDVVYDPLNFPGMPGTIKDIEEYLMVIEFGGKEFFFPFRLDSQGTNHHPLQLSKTPYTLEGFSSIVKSICDEL